MKVTFLGHAGVILESNGKRIAIDPFLSGNPLATIKAESLQVDAVLLTHGHGDHSADAATIAKQSNCPVIAVVELAALIEKSSGVQTVGVNTGGTYYIGDIKVKFVQAFHSSSYEVDGFSIYAGQPQGILVTMDNQTVYHMGDTALFSDIKLIGELNKIDLALIPIGDHFTMGPEEALIAAKWTGAGTVMPIHYNTFPPIVQDGATFAARIEEQGQNAIELKPGESFNLLSY